MSRLFFDVATSRWHSNKATGEEPRVLRIAWQKDDDEPICRIIQPASDTTIDPSTVPYHGLTLDIARGDGVDPAGVVAELETAARDVRTIVSFNQDFHWRHLHRLMGHVGAPIPTTAVCAMKLAEPIVAIQAMRPGGGLKTPSLKECCDFFKVDRPSAEGTPVELALSTVRAIREVFEACVRELPSAA